VKPTLGRDVHYRGNRGLNAMRVAKVVCTTKELMPEGVESGEAQALDSDMHVHLVVFTVGTQMIWPEANVPYAERDENGEIPPGTWTWPIIVK
jgi:hypothetical protein